MDTCITITFGECSENHVGMKQNGKISENGFNSDDLDRIVNYFNDKIIERIDLTKYLDDNYIGPKAELLIIRNAISNHSNIFNELNILNWDDKYFCTRKGKVLKKHARTNLCFGSYSQNSDFQNKIGTMIDFNTVPQLNIAKNILLESINQKNLECEGNRYYDIKKNGIGWHGDSERKKVIGLRLGETMSINFHWFINSKPIGNIFTTNLNSGDVYVMSEKTTGHDWKKRSIFTLRHSAGSDKYTKLNK